MNKLRGIYCDHLEKQMPRPSGQSVKLYPTGEWIEDFSFKDMIHKKDVPEHVVSERLVRFGLDPHEVELLMLRYIDNKSMLEIVEIQGWLSLNSANHYLRKALKKLREGKFSL